MDGRRFSWRPRARLAVCGRKPRFQGVVPDRDGHGDEGVGAPCAFKIVRGAGRDGPTRRPFPEPGRGVPPSPASASTRARTAGAGDAAATLATRTGAGGSGRPAVTARAALRPDALPDDDPRGRGRPVDPARGRALHGLMPTAGFETLPGAGRLPRLETPTAVLERLGALPGIASGPAVATGPSPMPFTSRTARAPAPVDPARDPARLRGGGGCGAHDHGQTDGDRARSRMRREAPEGGRRGTRGGRVGEGWWSQAGSNRRPPACHAGALPAELWPRAEPESLRDAAPDVNVRPGRRRPRGGCR